MWFASLLAASLLAVYLIFDFSAHNTKGTNIPAHIIGEAVNEESVNVWKNKNSQRNGSNSHYYTCLN
jgi:hypothetical protein